MKRALLLGDSRDARYHPLTGMDDALRSVFDGMFELEAEEEYGGLTLDRLRGCNMVLSYADNWKTKGTKAAAGALVAYVADGGNLLALHNGLIPGDTFELSLLLGGKFMSHPPQTLLDYFPTGADHAISERFEHFRTTEEPYLFDFDVFTKKEVLVEFRYANRLFPAVWCHRYGWGKVVCVVPGHQPESLHGPVRKLLYRSGLWFLDRV